MNRSDNTGQLHTEYYVMFYVENVKCLLLKYMLAWLVEGEGGRAYKQIIT